MTLPVLVINRVVDTDRLAAFSASAKAQGVAFERISAPEAHRSDFPFALYDDLIGPQFWGEAKAKPGAIGCFLGHRRAWQNVLDSGHEQALICEDDAAFQSNLDPLIVAATDLGTFDVLFANGRMAAWCEAVGRGSPAALTEMVLALSEAGGPSGLGLKTSPGADCYLITRRGAGRLLAMTESQGITCGVDWAILWNGLADVTGAVTAAFPEFAILSKTLTAPEKPLSIHVLGQAIADQTPETPSVIRHAETRPIAEMTTRSATLTHAEYVATLHLGDATLCFAGRSGPDPVMAAHREGMLWDEPGLRLLMRRFPEGGRFIDIGAHLGNHAIAMAVLGGAGDVLAVEPNDEITRLLETNIAMNGLSSRVSIHTGAEAFWHQAADGWLVRNRKRSSETMAKAEAPEDRTTATPVRLVPGDEVLAGQRIHAIKIDTSGSEPEVLRGLSRTLREQRPLVLVDHGEKAQDRIARLAEERGLFVCETVPSGRQNRVSSLLVPRPDGVE